jgi:hypothetical protein
VSLFSGCIGQTGIKTSDSKRNPENKDTMRLEINRRGKGKNYWNPGIGSCLHLALTLFLSPPFLYLNSSSLSSFYCWYKMGIGQTGIKTSDSKRNPENKDTMRLEINRR